MEMSVNTFNKPKHVGLSLKTCRGGLCDFLSDVWPQLYILCQDVQVNVIQVCL